MLSKGMLCSAELLTSETEEEHHQRAFYLRLAMKFSDVDHAKNGGTAFLYLWMSDFDEGSDFAFRDSNFGDPHDTNSSATPRLYLVPDYPQTRTFPWHNCRTI